MLAVVREHRVGMRHLEQRRRQAVAVAHRGLLDRPPGLVRAQPAGDGAGKADLRLLAEADLRVQLPHLARRASACAILHRADVARLLDHLAAPSACRADASRVIVEPPMRHACRARSGSCVVRRDAAGLQRQRDDERLHRRAGLEGVGQRAVAQLLAGEVLAVVRRRSSGSWPAPAPRRSARRARPRCRPWPCSPATASRSFW